MIQYTSIVPETAQPKSSVRTFITSDILRMSTAATLKKAGILAAYPTNLVIILSTDPLLSKKEGVAGNLATPSVFPYPDGRLRWLMEACYPRRSCRRKPESQRAGRPKNPYQTGP